MNITSSLLKTVFAFIFLFAFAITNTKAQSTINTSADFGSARSRIDSIDKQLIKLIGERERIVQAIGVYKAKNNIPPLQPARFQQVVNEAKKNGASEGLSPEFIEELMNAIHKESLRIEDEAKKSK
ncbi:chorismate mutase [Mucilaginibacter sp. KACC 22063]|uniref:chorismate mutase n=1 Tax=Mucilaginibacter sp. KACC 22063 TaxID=3025666 RepID=UPI00236712E2|nr:chorismate mutase [Mucilaginibacter sp. KACC 22063]WDF53345.1 chorismate mutase [Mucilaginibacter sp. KACC 22063]